VALIGWPAMRRLDEGGPVAARRVALIHDQPLFAPLSLASVEHLAGSLTPVRFEDGEWVIREGEAGDRYVLVDEGMVEVVQGGRHSRELGPGAGIGEIALLQAVPRTASVIARGPVSAYGLDRSSFLEAVLGHAASHAAASAVSDDLLEADATRAAAHS